MDKAEALAHYDGDVGKLASALGITRQAIYQWGDKVPRTQALELDRITRGRLVYRPELYARRRR